MQRNTFRLVAAFSLCALTASSSLSSHAAGMFGKDKDATAKVARGGPFKGQTSFALGAFRVAFITEDRATSVAKGIGSGMGGASSSMEGRLEGVDHALMQKIADQVYTDFLKQAADKGYTVIEPKKLASISAIYKAMAPAENYAEGRLGTLVIPTDQQSVELAADNSAKAEKGAKSMFGGFKAMGAMNATADANKAFPSASKEAGMPVIGVTIVVNFANFKGGSSSWGTSAKAKIEPGATIDGMNKGDAIPATAIVGWDSKTRSGAQDMAEIILEGQVHSTEAIGSGKPRSAMSTGDHIANGIGALYGTGQVNKKIDVIDADPALYEKNVLVVAAEATNLLLSAMASEK